jgi:hypothetical protein
MTWPPNILRIRIRRYGKVCLSMHLPLLLFVPFLVAAPIALLPVLLVVLVGYRPRNWSYRPIPVADRHQATIDLDVGTAIPAAAVEAALRDAHAAAATGHARCRPEVLTLPPKLIPRRPGLLRCLGRILLNSRGTRLRFKVKHNEVFLALR